ncbi:MAG: hypothetical protein JWN40_367 [Phycisphaerales bacterium]|nr:hypothetical protein [Phycisphaerales bacterium]
MIGPDDGRGGGGRKRGGRRRLDGAADFYLAQVSLVIHVMHVVEVARGAEGGREQLAILQRLNHRDCNGGTGAAKSARVCTGTLLAEWVGRRLNRAGRHWGFPSIGQMAVRATARRLGSDAPVTLAARTR